MYVRDGNMVTAPSSGALDTRGVHDHKIDYACIRIHTHIHTDQDNTRWLSSTRPVIGGINKVLTFTTTPYKSI